METKGVDIWSVSQLTRRVKGLLESEVGTVWVAGEVSNLRVSPAGHAYFTLKDPDSQVSAVMFRGRFGRVQFDVTDGMEVVLFGLVSVYERRGTYQIVCEELHPRGAGALQLAFEQLRKKLEEEGLFDEARKKPLPLFPRRIGIVTSPSGAAIRDILNVLERRFAGVHVLLYPARVQGDEAAPEIVAGIRALERYGVDVMIVGRGGGSLEDLWPFNEEAVVRAVFGAETPVISAVGHEVDFALTDFAADVRAPTPSAAAELVVRERAALLETVQDGQRRLARAVKHIMERVRGRVGMAGACVIFRRPEELLREPRQELDDLRARLETSMRDGARLARVRLDGGTRALALLAPANQLRMARERLARLVERMGRACEARVTRARSELTSRAGRLDALSPLAVLSRGYALARRIPDGAVLRDAEEARVGQDISVMLGRGSLVTKVESIEVENHGR